MKSLRGRLIGRTVGACIVCFVLAGVVLYFLLRVSLIHHFDAILAARADSIMAATEESDEGVRVEHEALPGEFSKVRDFFEMWADDGREISRSPSLRAQHLERPNSTKADFVRLPDGTLGRALVRTFVPRRDDERSKSLHAAQRKVTLSIARDARDLRRELDQTLFAIVMVFGLATLGTSAVMWRAVANGLRPMAALAERIKTAEKRGLSDRIELDDAPSELMPVVARLNELLARIESAFGREKAFTADVAHELRTPISGLEAVLDVCASRNRTGEEYREVVNRCRATVGQMHRLVEQLLLLARTESGQVVMELRWVGVDELLKECWDAVDDRAQQRDLSVEWDVPATLEIRSDRGLLAVVLHNLLDNAVSYADEGGKIVVRSEDRDDVVTLSVSNTGCRLGEAEVSKVFERFWRDDAARTGTGRHAGLGLSLCQKIMTLLGGTTMASVRSGGIFEVELRFDEMNRSGISETVSKSDGSESSVRAAVL